MNKTCVYPHVARIVTILKTAMLQVVCYVMFSDAISQNYASSKKRKRQEENGTYEKYQQDQKRRQRIKRVSIYVTD